MSQMKKRMLWATSAAAIILLLIALGAGAHADTGRAVKRLALSTVGVNLGHAEHNSTIDLTVRGVLYSNGKTHQAYGWPVNVEFVNAIPEVITLSETQKDSAGRPFVRITSKPGAAGIGYVWVKANGRTVARCLVLVSEVVRARGIRVAKSATMTYTLEEGASVSYFQLPILIAPATASANAAGNEFVRYTSTNPSVADVDENGKIHALRTGVAYIRAQLTDGSRLAAQCRVLVYPLPPSSVTMTLSDADGKLSPGETCQITPAVLPADAVNKGVIYASSNTRVATVDANGRIVARAPGAARIYCKTKGANRLTSAMVNVNYKYWFYGIANGRYRYAPDLSAYLNDLTLMNRMYSISRFDGAAVARSYRADLTGAGIVAYLNSIANNRAITEDSVTIVYYSGHGMDGTGAFCGVDVAQGRGTVPIETVRACLDRVKGQVILLVDSCASGNLIDGKEVRGKGVRRAASLLYNRAIINAFSGGSQAAGGPRSKAAGSLTNLKYHVLTACAADQSSYMTSTFSLFTYYLYEGTSGCGDVSSLASDQNGDRKVSLAELHTYVAPKVLELTQMLVDEYGAGYDVSDVQIWPAGDTTTVFQLPAA